MSDVEIDTSSPAVADRLQRVVWGTTDPRLRATWRVLLAWPLFWTLAGGVFAGNLQTAVPAIPSGQGPAAGLAQSLLHGLFVAVALVPWARYVDRQSLTDYGVSVSPRWILELLVGFVAVVVGFGAWLALGSILGRTSTTVSMSTPQGSLFLGLVVLVVALLVHAAIQQLVFFRIILENVAEGATSRGVDPGRSVVLAAVVALPFFVGMHGFPGGLRFVDLAVAGGIFGLLYLHTGELALGTGMHLGALYAGSVLFPPAARAVGGPTVLQVTGSLPGVLGTVNQYGFPKLVVAYALVIAWLTWTRGELPLREGIARAGRHG